MRALPTFAAIAVSILISISAVRAAEPSPYTVDPTLFSMQTESVKSPNQDAGDDFSAEGTSPEALATNPFFWSPL